MADPWAQAILSNPATVARVIRGEKGGVEIEAFLPYPIRVPRPPPPRALPEIRIPLNPRTTEQLVRREISSALSFGDLQVQKIHSTDTKNGSRCLKKKLVPSPKFIDPEQDILIARKMSWKSSQLLPHSNLDPFGG